MNREHLAEQWSTEGRRYAKAINEMVEFARQHGWDAWKAEEAKDGRDPALAEQVLGLLRQANEEGDVDRFRRDFPPAHAPFVASFEGRCDYIDHLVWLDSRRLAFVVGSRWRSQRGYLLDAESERLTALEDVRGLGISPDRTHVARATAAGIELRRGFDGPVTGVFDWPDAFDPEPDHDRKVRTLERLLVFPAGDRVLLVTEEGVFLASAGANRRIHPLPDPEDNAWTPHVDMVHATISPDGELICVGDQCSKHLILDSTGAEIGRVGTASEYPHHAAFSADGSVLALNSCHMYHGGTIAVPTSRVRGIETAAYLFGEDLREPCRLIDDAMRVYASDVLGDCFLFGEAGGYVRAVSLDGVDVWQHFCGSTISSLAVSPDHRTLAVGSASGMLHVIDLDCEQADPFQIGTAAHVERRRYVFWRDQPVPLRW